MDVASEEVRTRRRVGRAIPRWSIRRLRQSNSLRTARDEGNLRRRHTDEFRRPISPPSRVLTTRQHRHFNRIINQVAAGHAFVITRHGRPIALLVPPLDPGG
ncbi:type II toxin-antitoxin system Phd/YefM family antitoxin [Mycolicibacterium porcinum]|uniref:type II toxin-antitoxin system Phd/YefM family antitoxin n=1 Tax=Mycolicibacterium porcinum TaxID=39693 RepID=UPI003D1576CF